jgi:hypothetical protein
LKFHAALLRPIRTLAIARDSKKHKGDFISGQPTTANENPQISPMKQMTQILIRVNLRSIFEGGEIKICSVDLG